MRKNNLVIGIAVLTATMMIGCASTAENTNIQTVEETIVNTTEETTVNTTKETTKETESAEQTSASLENHIELEDGTYTAEFKTDSGMFHVNEANNGKGVLTVTNGEATIHVSLASKNILNLYYGLAEDAAKEGAVLLMPTTDTVKYSDGLTDEVYGFDIPVPVIDGEFDVALVGSKGKWYDHKVSVSKPEKITENEK